MVDELDPPLEARLRVALHAEVDAMPLFLGSSEILRARGQRRWRRLGLATLAAAVAVLAIVVVSFLPWTGLYDGAAGRPSSVAVNDLVAMLPPDHTSQVASGEGAGDGVAGTRESVDVGWVAAGSPVAYALSCAGDAVTITFDTGDDSPDTMSLACGAGATTGSLDWEAGPARVSITAPTDEPWRIAVASLPGPARQLAEYLELRLIAQHARSTGGVTVAQGEGPDPLGTGATRTTDLGVIGDLGEVALALDCIGGDIEIRITAGDRMLAGYKAVCEPSAHVVDLAIAAPDPSARLVVVASEDVSWRLRAIGPMPAASPSPSAS